MNPFALSPPSRRGRVPRLPENLPEVMPVSSWWTAGVGQTLSAVVLQPDLTAWNTTGMQPVTGSDPYMLVEDGSTGLHRIWLATPFHPNHPLTIRGRARLGVGSRRLRVGVTASNYVTFDFSTGTVVAELGATGGISGPDGSGFYAWAFAADGTFGGPLVLLNFVDGATTTYAGDGVSSMMVGDVVGDQPLLSAWADRRGAFPLVQLAQAEQPAPGRSLGRSLLNFDVDDNLVAGSTSDWQFLHDGTGGTVACCLAPKAPVFGGYSWWTSLSSAANGARVNITPAGEYRCELLNGTGTVCGSVKSVAVLPALNRRVILVSRFSATAIRFFLRDESGLEEEVADTAFTGPPSPGPSQVPLTVGRFGSSSEQDAREYGVAPYCITDAQVRAVADLLQRRWF